MNKITTRKMRAGGKFNRFQIYRHCNNMVIDPEAREWKKPFSRCSPAMMICCRPRAENNWRTPAWRNACKKPCVYCEAAGLQRGGKKLKYPLSDFVVMQEYCEAMKRKNAENAKEIIKNI